MFSKLLILNSLITTSCYLSSKSGISNYFRKFRAFSSSVHIPEFYNILCRNECEIEELGLKISEVLSTGDVLLLRGYCSKLI